MIKHTSPAANISPIYNDANIAITIKSAEDIQCSYINLLMARYNSGNPHIIIVTHAGSR